MGGGPRDMGLDEALEAVAAVEAAARRGNGAHDGASACSSTSTKLLGLRVLVSGMVDAY